MSRKSSLKKMLAVIALAAPVYSHAVNLQDALNAVKGGVDPGTLGQAAQALNSAKQLLGNGQAVPGVTQPAMTGSLTELLMQRVGVSQLQAQSGAGALFQVAKNAMSAEAFNRLGQSVPGMQGMLGAVPGIQQQSGLGALAGQLGGGIPGLNSGSSVGNLLSVAAAFQQQGMSPAMIQQFIPVVLEYVKAKAGPALSNSLSAALIGK